MTARFTLPTPRTRYAASAVPARLGEGLERASAPFALPSGPIAVTVKVYRPAPLTALQATALLEVILQSLALPGRLVSLRYLDCRAELSSVYIKVEEVAG